MAEYMLLLYADETTDEAEQAERAADMPVWFEVTKNLEEAGLLRATGRLHAPASATTLRLRNGEAELTDGPFAVTKEVIGGYYVIECENLDQALEQAAKLPIARYGSVEVRPVMSMDEMVAGRVPEGATEGA